MITDKIANMGYQFQWAVSLHKKNLPIVLFLIGGLYAIHLLNCLTRYHLSLLGIYPRRWFGLPGIFFSPFLHANFNHLFFNSLPLFALLSFVLLSGWDIFFCVSMTIIFIGGLATWLLGRSAIHIGASGLIMGYWSYLLLNAYHQGTTLSIALGLICIYYFGSLLLNLFPLEVKSSWEMHVFGFVGGLVAAYTCPLHHLSLLRFFVTT